MIKETESSTKNDDERFDGDLMLMTGELSKLMADVVEALAARQPRKSSRIGTKKELRLLFWLCLQQ